MNDNLTQIVAIELLTGAQGIEFRQPIVTSERLCRTISRLRETVATLGEDRYLADDLSASADLVRSEDLLNVAGREVFPVLSP